jgi:glucosamine--fructose-6-phosphate aminotransferase (isomerizing)
MRREIEAIPEVVARFLAESADQVGAAVAAVRRADPAFVAIVARGTSDHAAIHLRYLIEVELGIPTGLVAPSVTTIYGAPVRWQGGLVIAVSQSGRSPDLVAVMEAATGAGATTITIANDASSPLAAAAQHVIDCRAGEERSVAATKSYVAQLAAGAALVGGLSRNGALGRDLGLMPAVLAGSLAAASAAITDDAPIVAAFAGSERSIVLSRGFDFPTALETALKLKETGRLFAEGYSSADFSHGPVVLSGPGVPVLAIRPDGLAGPAVDEAVRAAIAAGGDVWVVGGAGLTGPTEDRLIHLPLPPDLPESLAPLATILPGQLLAEAVSRRRGYDPDAPAGLHKVTLTR